MTLDPVPDRMRVCIVVACLLLGGCADSQVQSSSTEPESSDSPGVSQDPTFFLRGSRSVADGVYTAAQSRRGELQYLEICKDCHMRDLAGDFVEDAPPLVGDEFLGNWAQWTVGDLYEFLATEMPPKQKDRVGVTAETYVDIVAFMLDKNGYPAGDEELPAEFDPLADIEMSPGP